MPTDTGATSGNTPPPPSGRRGTRRLVRFPHEGPLGGVCAGVADYLDIDPTIVRIAAVVLAITGPGIPAYVLAWIFVPAADGHIIAPWPQHPRHHRDRTSEILGIGAIAIALIVLWGSWWRPAHGWFIPIGLIAFGAWLLLRNRDEDELPPHGPGADTPPIWQPTPPSTPFSVTPAPFPPTGVTEPTSGVSPSDPTGVLPSGENTGTADSADATTDASYDPWYPYSRRYSRGRRARRRRVLGPIVFGALLLWGGIAWLIGISAQDGLAVGLCIMGVGFVIGAFVGGSKVLILPALVVAAALVVASTVDIPLASGVGDRTWRISAMSDLDRSYALGIGDATLDLGNLPLASGQQVDVAMKVGIGQLEVLVPNTATVDVATQIGAGDSRVFEREDSGTSLKTSRSFVGAAGGGHLRLDLHLGLGRITVRRVTAPTISST